MNKNFSIAILCITAVILGAAVYFMQTTTPQASASTPSRAGDYLMFSAAVDNGTDMLYVIDSAEQKMNAYLFNPSNNNFALKDQMNLRQLFAAK